MLPLNELAEQLYQRQWTVDCPEMRLDQPSVAGLSQLSGPGYLRQEDDGVIRFKLYASQNAIDLQSIHPRTGVPGRLLGDSSFHRLEAMDMRGNVWNVERALPVPDTSLIGSKQFRVVRGDAHGLVTTMDQPNNVSTLKMFFFTEERVPGNASTTVTTITPDGSEHSSSKLDTAQFETAFGVFHIYNRSGMLVVDVVTQTAFPTGFSTRIVESLGFVLAKPLMWNVLELIVDGKRTIRLRGDRQTVDAKIQPPVVSGTIDMSGGDVWRLFDKYLAMVCSRTEQDFHPASRHVFSALEASAGVIGARALALGVAVEGLVKDLFPNAGALPTTLKPVVKRLRKHCLAWSEFSDEETRKQLHGRIEAMLGRILEVSAKSKLYSLANQKGVRETHIAAWGDLRHAAAHGVTPGSDDLQKLVDLCDTVSVLMYQIIFCAVGYEGRYRDYSVRGWPKKYYRGRSPTEEEISVAAYYIWKKNGEILGSDVENWLVAKDELEKELY